MKVVVDGLPENVPDKATLKELLEIREEPTEHVIVEVNGSFVHPNRYSRTKLKPGDKIEVVYPAFGG